MAFCFYFFQNTCILKKYVIYYTRHTGKGGSPLCWKAFAWSYLPFPHCMWSIGCTEIIIKRWTLHRIGIPMNRYTYSAVLCWSMKVGKERTSQSLVPQKIGRTYFQTDHDPVRRSSYGIFGLSDIPHKGVSFSFLKNSFNFFQKTYWQVRVGVL